MVGEKPAHTGIPIADPAAEIPLGLILDIKAVASRAEIGAGSTIEATLINPVP